jgi:SAM-dependent methyltransferase
MAAQVASRRFTCTMGVRHHIDEAITGKSVLDIGIVQHTIKPREATLDPQRWRHARIREVARECWGVDILEDEVQKLQEYGIPDLHAVDATSHHYLGRTFEAVHIGDVIEHVDNPVALLRFSARHLDPGGRIYATTPNPFCLHEIRHFLKTGYSSRNAEHTCWITPTMAIEIAHRAGVKLHGIGVTLPGIGRPHVQWVSRLLNRFFPPEFIGGEYLYVFEAGGDVASP